jgi:hypothetical protein
LTEKINASITITNNYERLDIDAPIKERGAKERQKTRLVKEKREKVARQKKTKQEMKKK